VNYFLWIYKNTSIENWLKIVYVTKIIASIGYTFLYLYTFPSAAFRLGRHVPTIKLWLTCIIHILSAASRTWKQPRRHTLNFQFFINNDSYARICEVGAPQAPVNTMLSWIDVGPTYFRRIFSLCLEKFLCRMWNKKYGDLAKMFCTLAEVRLQVLPRANWVHQEPA
jgi:hypothetical protein